MLTQHHLTSKLHPGDKYINIQCCWSQGSLMTHISWSCSSACCWQKFPNLETLFHVSCKVKIGLCEMTAANSKWCMKWNISSIPYTRNMQRKLCCSHYAVSDELLMQNHHLHGVMGGRGWCCHSHLLSGVALPHTESQILSLSHFI